MRMRKTAVRAFRGVSERLGTTIDLKSKPCKQPFALPILQRRMNIHPNTIPQHRPALLPYTAVSALSPSATIGTLSPRSGDCNTNCSCRLALKKSLTARIKMNQPTIIRTYANQSLLAIPERPLELPESWDAAMAAAAAAEAASLDTADGSKSWLLGSGG